MAVRRAAVFPPARSSNSRIRPADVSYSSHRTPHDLADVTQRLMRPPATSTSQAPLECGGRSADPWLSRKQHDRRWRQLQRFYYRASCLCIPSNSPRNTFFARTSRGIAENHTWYVASGSYPEADTHGLASRSRCRRSWTE